MERLLALLLITSAAAFSFAGCTGYQLGSIKPAAYAGIDALHVPTFKNDTLEPRLSSLLTNAVLKELQSDGTYRVTTRNNCDAVLVGRITEIRKRQLRATRADTLESQELSLYIFVAYHLEDPVTGQQIQSTAPVDESSKDNGTAENTVYKAKQGTIYGSTIQFVDRSFQVGERAALSAASEDVAKKMVSYLANGW